MAAFPAGSRVEGTIYITADALDECTLTVELTAEGERIGTATVGPRQVVGLGGAAWEPFAFSFDLTGAVPEGARPELEVHVQATESWFMGFDGDHTSSFKIAPPT